MMRDCGNYNFVTLLMRHGRYKTDEPLTRLHPDATLSYDVAMVTVLPSGLFIHPADTEELTHPTGVVISSK